MESSACVASVFAHVLDVERECCGHYYYQRYLSNRITLSLLTLGSSGGVGKLMHMAKVLTGEFVVMIAAEAHGIVHKAWRDFSD